MSTKFDTSLADSQASAVRPVSVKKFDFEAYSEYAGQLDEQCMAFWKADSGVLVYRRMRVAECFSYGCRDMKNSLELQLGALQASMQFKADVPNFLEPWYGIGTIASAFGEDYIWHPGAAPAIKPTFSSLPEILDHNPLPVEKTSIGSHTLEMIAYFMEQTKGRLPISLTDTQSPLNIIGNIYPIDNFLMDMLIIPDKAGEVLKILADLIIDFNKLQRKLIGDALVYPGHGFSASRAWQGLGMSDDNAIMVSPEDYLKTAVPSAKRVADEFGGLAFHSCGNWEQWIEAVLNINGLLMADGAFSAETDPDANSDLESFHKFAHTGIILNARMVGSPKVIEEQVRKLWVPGMKLIVVTYCKTPEEQDQAYRLIHEIADSK